MFNSIWNDVKMQFSYGTMVTRLIIVNVIVFIIINILKIFLRFGGRGTSSDWYSTILDWFKISSDPLQVLLRPWTLFTHMFMHEGVFHMLWNMLFLYWFGRIISDLIGDRKILPLYILGGLTGAVVFILSVNLLPFGAGGPHTALGASAGIMAIVVASGVVAPEYNIHLLLIGPVKLKYVVIAIVFLDIIGTAGDINTGGHFAHLGGALAGWFFIQQLKSGNDLSIPINKVWDKITSFFGGIELPSKSSTSPKPKVVHRNEEKIRKRGPFSRNPNHRSDSKQHDISHQEKLDAILDKIKKEGYESLTEAEKEFLFNASKK